ncbi:hypothetical protein [Streptomyces sp. PU_AKi4]|uniref:hypothetical protein n=1 Tax=Streptomyces sp. PU_AKi4 TaxID=2800809 RepID=UPI0035252133
MSLVVSVTLDSRTRGGVGCGLVSWFGAALDWPLAQYLEREREGTAETLATTLMDEGDEDKEFSLAAGGWAGMRAELLRAPELVSVLVALPEIDRPAVHVMSSSILVKRPNAEVQILVSGEDGERSADPAFCRSVVDFLISALDPVNPAFGRVCVGEPVTPRANLDAVLKRKIRKSVAEARQFLRGYAWVTVCPAELTDALGGADALKRSGAFHRVVSLASGGTVLQATETIAAFSDEAMHKTFHALAPVLPPGLPRFNPAAPYARFVPEDAGRSAGGRR